MLSFIIPAYNEELELPSTIAAIRKAAGEGGQPYEIIVVDDASTDATRQIAANAGARVLSINRRHIAAARNAGARVAQGDILFLSTPTRKFIRPMRWMRLLLSMRDIPEEVRASLSAGLFHFGPGSL